MERIFASGHTPSGILANIEDAGTPEYNAYLVKALIEDAVDYDRSFLAPNREKAQRYYYGLEPFLSSVDESQPIFGDPPVDDGDEAGRSTIVSTDVRDTVLSIMPSLMRIFASSEHSVEFMPNNAQSVDMAAQATDYIRYKFWHSNEGFLTLYEVFKDALTLKSGIVTWWSDNSTEIKEEQFSNVSPNQIGLLLSEATGATLVSPGQMNPVTHLLDGVVLKYKKSTPQLKVESVPPDEFRISRDATSIYTSDLVGREQYLRASELVARGFRRDLVQQFVGADPIYYTDERFMRNPGNDMFDVLGDRVQYGVYLVRYDSDDDGINELHCVHTFGDDFAIVDDYIVSDVNFAMFCPDPTPHTAIGESIADIVMDLQRIKTNLIRGGLDSLAQSLFPRTGVNEMLVNMEDMLDDSIGGFVRTRGDPSAAIYPITTPFVGNLTFEMTDRIDAMRQSRTGISEASKGVDPKALQSTTLTGVDAIVSGAQERIEIIARILAETGMKKMYEGLLRETINNPNPGEMAKLNGNWVSIDPSTYDASMRCVVNPALGKGSDWTRLTILGNVLAQQKEIVAQYGLGNGVVGIQEMQNTINDMLAINNIKSTTRYFKTLSPQQIQAMESAPKEPTPEMIAAQALMEKNKTDGAVAVGKQQENQTKQAHQIVSDTEKLKWEKQKTAIEAFISLATLAKEAAADADANVTSYVEPREND